ncbi:MAG TPA: MarR family transcriptional regulator [Candidatus Angelobacter sp.]|jgi:DNA-binding MarR family transcriptional regulator|nr:MarR family transcriptional regulator [Candidatus Angelobacter sp.]
MKGKDHKPLNDAEYLALAEFRYQIRKYLRHMEDRARQIGLNPQQYQVLLAIKGLPKDKSPTISAIAERMQLNHNSMVELVDRCEERGLLRRARSASDRRQVILAITPDGETLMRQQAAGARQQLRTIGPVLSESIRRLLEDTRNVKDALEGERRSTRKKRNHSTNEPAREI